MLYNAKLWGKTLQSFDLSQLSTTYKVCPVSNWQEVWLLLELSLCFILMVLSLTRKIGTLDCHSCIHGARVCICILQIVLVSLTLHVWIANRMHVYLRDGSPFPQWSSMRWVFHETVQNCVSWSICNHMPLVSHPSHGHIFHNFLNPNSYFCICVAVAFVVTFLLRVSDRKTAGIWEDCSIWFWWLPCQDRYSQVCPTYQDCLCCMEFASLVE